MDTHSETASLYRMSSQKIGAGWETVYDVLYYLAYSQLAGTKRHIFPMFFVQNGFTGCKIISQPPLC